MKTIELKWIEDDNHTVAKNACGGLQDLIDSGVFPDLTAKCEDDTLYITGDKGDLDKAVMKIQKAYAKYGQIMIKEAKNGTTQELRIESFDENVQDIFNHTLADYNKFKSTKERPLNYVKQLNDYRFKFKKFYETAARSDKKLLKPYLDEISNLLDESEIITKIKPVKAKLEEETMIEYAKEICEAAGKKILDPEEVDTIGDVVDELVKMGYNKKQAQDLTGNLLFKQVIMQLVHGRSAEDVATYIDETYMTESEDNALTKQLGNPANWGIIEEGLDQNTYNKKFNKVLVIYSEETGKGTDDAYDELMDNDELPELVDSPLDPYEIVDKLLGESTMNESFLSPGELKKKLQRVAARWASIQGIKFEDAYNELRRKKSVKDMLDFYSVDEIIDDLSKNKKEVDDELEEEI